MILARASLGDLAAITALECAGFDHASWSADAWRGEIVADDRLVLVARTLVDDDVIGVVTVQTVLETADLHRVVVRPDRRGEGIGRRLVRAGVEWAAAMGAQRMLLEVDVANVAARRLYDGLGFVPLSKRRDYYGQGLDALVMALDLGASWRETA